MAIDGHTEYIVICLKVFPNCICLVRDGMYESLIGLCLLKSFVRVAIYKAQHNIQRCWLP